VRIPKIVRNILLSAFIMIVALVIAGAAYVYFVGGQTAPQRAKPAASESSGTGLPKAVKPAANAPEGVSVQSLVTPVKAGENTSVSIRALPDSTCTIVVTYNDVPAKDSGLVAKKTNAYGFTDWTWTVSPGAPAGTWPVKITCTYNGKSGVVIGDLQVTK
jgi:uncharacterized iron-regulated membrane protein